jgi:hypothetical protein
MQFKENLPAILVGSGITGHNFGRAIQGPFHQNLVAIGSVDSEEKIFM